MSNGKNWTESTDWKMNSNFWDMTLKQIKIKFIYLAKAMGL